MKTLEQNREFNCDELGRYARHFALAEIGFAGQQQLKNARVLCIGAGGLGVTVLKQLVAGGIGTLGIIDGDYVELSNLQRQTLYTTHDVSMKKVRAAKANLKALNPQVHIKIYDDYLTEVNALTIIKDYDLVIDCTDHLYSHYLISDACVELKKPCVYGHVGTHQGECSIFTTQSKLCYRCLNPKIDASTIVPSSAEIGMSNAISTLVGSMQANEAIKLLLNIGQSLAGKLLEINLLNLDIKQTTCNVSACELCQGKQSFQTMSRPTNPFQLKENVAMKAINEITVTELAQRKQQNEDFLLVDIRHAFEQSISTLGGTSIPFAELIMRKEELDPQQDIIVYCRTGSRGYRACLLLMEAGFNSVYNLKGGINEWARQFEPTMAIY